MAHESMVAGAYVVCLPDSGNVAAAVQQSGRGRVLPNEAAFLAFFEGGGACDLVRELDGRHMPDLEVEDTGTTATIVAKLPNRTAKQRVTT